MLCNIFSFIQFLRKIGWIGFVRELFCGEKKAYLQLNTLVG
jgi:hypothetical protein